MAVPFNKFNSFVEAVAEKKHDLGADALTVALCAAANAPVAANAVLADLTQIGYTNLSTRVITHDASVQSGGTYKLTLVDLRLTAGATAIGPFRYVVIYNDTAANKELVAWYDYGAEITLNPGEYIDLDFDGTNGVLTLA